MPIIITRRAVDLIDTVFCKLSRCGKCRDMSEEDRGVLGESGRGREERETKQNKRREGEKGRGIGIRDRG